MDTMAGARGAHSLEAAKAGVVEEHLSHRCAATHQPKWGPNRRSVVGRRSLPPVGRCGSWVSTLGLDGTRRRELPSRSGTTGPLVTTM